MVTYFQVEDYPGQYFACGRYGTMSVSACSRNYTDAPQAIKAGRLEGCVGCAIGAAHAGAPAPTCRSTAPAFAQHATCVRCRRSGSDSTSRLIGRMRLVRGHTICVSCYNREREVLHGANAKGAKPKKWSILHRPPVAYVHNSRITKTELISPAVDRIEVALTLLRQPNTTHVLWASVPVFRLPLGVV